MSDLHPRTEIRNALKAQLIGTAPDFRTAAAARVEKMRFLPWEERKLPAIGVYIVKDPVDPESLDTVPKMVCYRPLIAIEFAVEGEAGTVDDLLDAGCLEIMRAVDLDPTLGGKTGALELKDTTIAIDENGRKTAGIATMVYEGEYYVTSSLEVPDNFVVMDAHYVIKQGLPLANQAEDLVTLET